MEKKRAQGISPWALFSSCGRNRIRFASRALNPFLPAERTGFEPAKPFGGLHAFQACLFNHSSTSPCLRLQNYEIIFEYQKLLSHFRWYDGKSPLQ